MDLLERVVNVAIWLVNYIKYDLLVSFPIASADELS